jgi:polysaccharide export outer membrane protein
VGKHHVPRELNKVTLPVYRIEPPDVLSIDVVQQVAQSSYALHAGDAVLLTVLGALPNEPIAGVFSVGVGGVLQLGYGYGEVEVAGLTVDDATKLIEAHLRNFLREPQVTMTLHEVSGLQRISGEHLVGPDGTVTLGRYGSVPVVGLTLEEARGVIADHLSQHFANAEVSVSVFAFNSKVYYIVTQGAGLGDSLTRLPFTGNETVLDALSHINGLSPVSSTRVWIARPDRDSQTSQVLPVDWEAISQRGEVQTNYQLLPGDRLYIAEDSLVAFDGAIAKLTAPIERIFGFTLLGTATASRLSGKVLRDRSAVFAPVN